MNIVIIGSGGREHALCYKLLKSSKINKIYCIPGNAGTDEIATNIFADINDFDEIYINKETEGFFIEGKSVGLIREN